MKITKFVHSCLLVEDQNKVVLFDPGVFSWNSGVFHADDLLRLDLVVITHEHPDHFHLPFIEALIKKFPDVHFISTQSVVNQLKEVGIQNASSKSVDNIEIFSTERHAELEPLNPTPENIAVHFADKLTVTGDRQNVQESVKDILALSMTGPWGSAVAAAQMALRLKPKHVIPVHDWHWNDEARRMEYDRFESILSAKDITFYKAVDGQPIEIA